MADNENVIRHKICGSIMFILNVRVAMESSDKDKVEFDEGIFLDAGSLYCAFCLATELEPKKAITINNGDAACQDHAYFKSEFVQLFASNYFKALREKNLKEAEDKGSD